jgi:hypothetical protein
MSTPLPVPDPLSPPPPPPPTSRYNPGNVCNPLSPTVSKPSNICNPSTPSKAGNGGQQTGAATPQNGPLPGPAARMNSGECHTINGQTTRTDAAGNSCTTAGNFCDPTAPQAAKAAAAPTPPKPNEGPLNLKPKTQMASVAGDPSSQASQNALVPACSSKPPYLPWVGTGSAIITVSGGKPCGVGWHDTASGPGGVTVLDSMTVTSQRRRAIPLSILQHPFTLSMQEHNGGRSATPRVNVSVTIQ